MGGRVPTQPWWSRPGGGEGEPVSVHPGSVLCGIIKQLIELKV